MIVIGIEERFWSKIDMADTTVPWGCWNWNACRSSNGKGERTYGSFHLGDRMVKAHRVAYELVIGPIPDGLQIDHLCKNKACVNPWHMEPVTQGQNMVRGTQIERAREWAAGITHCPQGHAYTSENTAIDAGKRKCRECLRERQRQLRARQKGQ